MSIIFPLISIMDVDNLNCPSLWSSLIMTLCILVPWTHLEEERGKKHDLASPPLYICAALIYHLNSLPEPRKYLHSFPFAIAIREKRTPFY